MKTVRDVKQLVKGPVGAIIRAMPDNVKALFVAKAEELGQQIAADNNIDFETGDVLDSTPLGDTALRLFGELENIKNEFFRRRVA